MEYRDLSKRLNVSLRAETYADFVTQLRGSEQLYLSVASKLSQAIRRTQRAFGENAIPVTRKTLRWFEKYSRRKFPAMSFSLIELLVVVAIISILASMLMPALSKARSVSLKAKCAGNLKQIGTGVGYYGNDYDNYVPAYRFIYWAAPNVQARGFASGLAACMGLPKATKDLGWVGAPSDLDENGEQTNFTNRNLDTIFRCPADPFPEPSMGRNYPSSYGINIIAATDVNYIDSRPWRTFSQIKRPASLSFIADTLSLVGSDREKGHEIYSTSTNNLGNLHNGDGNYLFLDSHVESKRPSELPTNWRDPFWWPEQ